MQVLAQFFPPKPKWTQADVPDLAGRVIIVTGGNNGIGKETVKTLLEHDAKVYMASRSKARAEAAIAELRETTGKEAIFLELDLSNLAKVRKAAEEFMSKEPALHVLYNNGGVMSPPIEDITADGYDMQFGTNVLGHFFFTELLLPALLAGVESSPDNKARVVNVSSSGAYLGSLNFDTFKDSAKRRKSSPESLYYQSKLGNSVYAAEFARRYGDKGIVTTSLNPGSLKTDMQQNAGLGLRLISPFVLYPSEMGAITQLWAGTAVEALDCNGEFLIPWARVGKGPKEASDLALGKQLYAWLEEQVKDH